MTPLDAYEPFVSVGIALAAGLLIGLGRDQCLGASALAGPVRAPLHTLGVDLAALVFMTGIAAMFIRSERTISRHEGAVAVTLYVAFAVVTIVRG